MSEKPANAERSVAEVAARQHGVLSIGQLRALGIDDDTASYRVRCGRLHRVHRGVYAIGHPRLTFAGRCFAAVLACAGAPRASEAPHWGAAVSHRSAGALWGMLAEHDGPIEITLSGDGGRSSRRGIRVHRPRSLPAGVSTRCDGVPVTTARRTLRDLKRTVPEEVVQRAFRKALDLRLVGPDALGPEPDLTRSKLEKLFLALCRRHRLPLAEVNARVCGYEVDFVWRAQRVVVEADSWRHHSDRVAFESDRERDQRLLAAGYRVLRFTYRQVVDSPEVVAGSLRAVLRSRGEGAA